LWISLWYNSEVMGKAFYITTTAPYVNSKPHIGFAWEIVAADVIARYRRLLGDEVAFGTGTDEHGVNIYRQAQEASLDPQAYADQNAKSFEVLKTQLNLSLTHFQRTTNPDHIAAAQEFWRRCEAAGDIYKKLYKVKYCTGCELEKTESELEDGVCPLHPTKKLEIIEEENYFFRFSKYEKELTYLYTNNPQFVLPSEKLKEIKAFVDGGLKDFSISRIKEKMPWGVPVPGDPEQVMYVWFDALVFYISTLGWPETIRDFKKFWPGVQIAGKDNLRQQAAMWQAMLMSAQLPNSAQVLINGFISVEGQKMSKTLGNVIAPDEMIGTYGLDGTRYLLINIGPVAGDADVSWDKFSVSYAADLANSLGNTVQRVATLAARSGIAFAQDSPPGFRSQVKEQMEAYRLDKALFEIWQSIAMVEKHIDETKPWKLEGKKLQATLMELIAHLRQVGYELQPFMPETAEKILTLFKGPKIEKPEPLFPRID
jgi:methionyl-tRNA synthetase